MQKFKSPEEVAIAIREAGLEDVKAIEDFLSRPEIDSLFVPPLSSSARGMSITERVERKMNSGKWVVAVRDEIVVGCMAIVPAKLTKEVQPPKKEGYISKGISLDGWKKDQIWELSTVVVDQDLLKKEGVKGIGSSLLRLVKNWVKIKGTHAGLITDSWVGGDMGGFIMAMNKKEYESQHKGEEVKIPDTLVRIYTDPAKRGESGPPTVIYGIPLDNIDWNFFESKQAEIKELEKEYVDL